jgi:hypothetical protein
MPAVLEQSMGRRKAGKDTPLRDDKTVKFDRTLADKAGYVCARRGLTLAEYLSELCRSRIESDFRKETAKTGGDA